MRDGRNRSDQLAAVMTEARHRTLYGELSLTKRIDLEKESLFHFIVDAVRNKKQKPVDVLLDLGLYSLPLICRRVDESICWKRGVVGRQLPSFKSRYFTCLDSDEVTVADFKVSEH